MKARVETVTPARARKMLEGAKFENRALRQRQVASLVAAMEGGYWSDTGAPIRYDTLKRLVDGQHRLTAIVKSGKTQRLLILRDVPINAIKDIDRGIAVRSAADVLHFNYPQYNKAMCSLIAKTVTHINNFSTGVMDARYNLSSGYIEDFVGEHPELWECAIHIHDMQKHRKVFPMEIATAILFQLKDIAYPLATQFFTDLYKGVGLAESSPVYQFRRKLDELRKPDGKRGDLARNKAWMCMLCWNEYAEGKHYRSTRFLSKKINGEWPKLNEPSRAVERRFARGAAGAAA